MHLVRRAQAFWENLKPGAPRWACPCCGYRGAFRRVRRGGAVRPFARCPACRALERHRIQVWAISRILEERTFGRDAVLHCAPDGPVGAPLERAFRRYVGADFEPRGDQIRIDLRAAPEIPDGSYDMVVASHVLEHVDDDRRALAEIARVLRPGGCAVLPVPVVADRTAEYPGPCETEYGHVRAPGLDYFDRYRAVFDSVELFRSADAPDAYQTWVHEDRSRFPTERAPWRPPQAGTRHEDFVPVCWKARTA